MSAPAEPNQNRFKIPGLLAVVAVAAVVAFALLQKTPPSPAEMPAAFPTPLPQVAVAATPGPAAQTGEAPAWEAIIDQILRSNVSEAEMAQMLINILPSLPEDGQIEAANHIANLLPDSDYNSVRPLLLNASLPESVLSVFFTDLMNRDDPTKLNAFLDIAQIPNHPFHDEALSDLQIYLGDDYGTDWGQWRAHLNSYLNSASQQ
jgi:hypothetical protein